MPKSGPASNKLFISIARDEQRVCMASDTTAFGGIEQNDCMTYPRHLPDDRVDINQRSISAHCQTSSVILASLGVDAFDEAILNFTESCGLLRSSCFVVQKYHSRVCGG